MFKFLFKGLLGLLITGALFFSLGEFTLRYIQYRTKPPSKVRQKDALVHHSFRPSTSDIARSPEWESNYKINNLGMRDKDYSEKKPDNIFRILVIGDSYTEGQGVEAEETSPKLLEKALGDKMSGKKIEVLNAGTLSYSPVIEYLYLKHKGVKLQPDLVILNFDQGDIIDDHWYEPEVIKDEKDIPVGFRVAKDATFSAKPENKNLVLSIKKFLHENSAFYLFVANSVKVKKIKLYPEIGDNTVIPGNIGTDKLITTREPSTEGYDGLWNFTKRNLKLINDLLKENNIKLLINDYPYGHQVNATEWAEGRKAWAFEARLYSEDKNFKTLASFAQENGILYHSMVEDFRKEQRHPLFFSKDGHWTKLGHEVAAKSIEKYLFETKLLPE